MLFAHFVTSRLDYSNSLLYGTSKKEINRLQRLQNRAAKLIFNAPKYDHASPYLQELHWFPVMERIEFKILVFVFKYFTGCAPSYIEDIIFRYRPGRSGFVRAWIPEFFPNQELILSPQIKVFMLPPLHSGTIFLTISVMLLHLTSLRKS